MEHIVKLARKGLTPSQIGVVLRDSHGIPQVRFVTGNKILRILKAEGMYCPSHSSVLNLMYRSIIDMYRLNVTFLSSRQMEYLQVSLLVSPRISGTL